MIGGVLSQGRAAFERRMRASIRVDRVVSRDTDPLSGKPIIAYRQVYAGKAYFRYPGLAWEQNHTTGAAQLVTSRIVCRIPFGAQLLPGDVVNVLADADNPQMVGSKFTVDSTDDQSQSTAQRIIVTDYQSGLGS